MYGIATYNATKKFIQQYGDGIAKAIKGTGIFFSVAVGQKAYESGYGKRIPVGSNNFGGIKYNPSLPGVVGFVLSDTTEYVKGKKVNVKQKFSKFKDVESGFRAYIQVLLLDRYKNARLLAKTPEEQIFMIAKAGYTTTPAAKYRDMLSPLIEAARDISKIGRIK
jgi:flagellum-specific peptidoglycan hydrolase FlgJ